MCQMKDIYSTIVLFQCKNAIENARVLYMVLRPRQAWPTAVQDRSLNFGVAHDCYLPQLLYQV